ncbi:MAG: hypothetical protein RR565_08120 [Erysipelothrix sp.]
MNKTLEIIGFENVRQDLAKEAKTLQAKEQILNLKMYEVQEELEEQLMDTSSARKMLDTTGPIPLPSIEEIIEILEMLKSGILVEPTHIQRIGDFFKSSRQLKEYLKKNSSDDLDCYMNKIVYPDIVYENIDRSIRSGEIIDEATNKLLKLRSKLKKMKPELRITTQQILDSNMKYMSENFVVNRDGHWCVPLKKEFQNKVPGTAMGRSSSGSTVFIEPARTTKLQETYFQTKLDMYQEEAAIISALSEDILIYDEQIRASIKCIIKLDFIFAKGKLSQKQNASCPTIMDERVISIHQGRHPSLNSETCVPLDFEIGGETQGIVVTGPNTGGKTVSIKTVAIITTMANMGLHVPAKSASVGFNLRVLCDIGDGQSIENNLSTFSAHITNVIDILENMDEKTLVVMDELGSGTDPEEGMGIAIAILEELRVRNNLFLVTTHYPAVKEYAYKHEEVMNARMAFDRENLQPKYMLELGKDGQSSALYIAKRLGVSKRMLRIAAQEAYGEIPREIEKELEL